MKKKGKKKQTQEFVYKNVYIFEIIVIIFKWN